MNNTVKKCTVCGSNYTLDHFRRTALSSDGYANICKACAKTRRSKNHTKITGGGNPELARFQPRELIEELKARGYSGKLTIIREIQL